jgi:asparagine synthase (glutamine-hydrolysing)
MGHLGVGVDAPLLDRDLLAFVMAIPGHMTNHGGRQRSILRDAMRGVAPNEVVERRSKADFTRLTAIGLADDVDGADDLLLDGAGVSRGYLDPGTLARRLPGMQAQARTADVFPGEMSDLLGFELWLRWVAGISRVQSAGTRGEGEVR